MFIPKSDQFIRIIVILIRIFVIKETIEKGKENSQKYTHFFFISTLFDLYYLKTQKSTPDPKISKKIEKNRKNRKKFTKSAKSAHIVPQPAKHHYFYRIKQDLSLNTIFIKNRLKLTFALRFTPPPPHHEYHTESKP